MITQKELIRELHQALFGIPGTDDGGICEDVKQVKKLLHAQNGSVRDNTIWRRTIVGVGSGWLMLLTGTIIWMLQNGIAVAHP